MTKFSNLLIVVVSVPMIVGMTGFLLVAFNLITVKNSKKLAVLLSTLFAAIEMWFAARLQIDFGQGGFDLFILFFVLWFLTYFIFWLGMVVGINKFQRSVHDHKQDFVHSSILSMQYEETRIADESKASHHRT
jgi:uncharacterized membrane protein YciS (DUF1049 family)